MIKKLICVGLFAILLNGCASTPANDSNDNDGQPDMQQRMLQASQINTQLGLAYMEHKQMPRAKETLLLAVQQNPKSVTALDALAYFWEVTGNNQLADQYYRKAISIGGDSGRAMNNYGAYLCRIKQYSKAEKYLLAAGNNPDYSDSAAAMENAGLCELLVPNVAVAEKYFQKAIAQDPNRPTSYYELAQISYKQKNYKLANYYLNGYNSTGARSPQALWLAIRVANKQHNEAELLRNAGLLEKYYPNSNQYQLYQKMQLS